MKRIFLSLLITAMITLAVMSSGCGTSETVEEDQVENGGEVTVSDYDMGLVEGYEDGYEQGRSDGEQGIYEPEADIGEDWNEDYALGYEEGYLEGYEDGHSDALDESDTTQDEIAEVEAAMLAFVRENSAPGMEFKIEDIVIHGDEAAGIAVCTSERLESPLIIMKRGTDGWYGVNFGTGIEPPSWYQP